MIQILKNYKDIAVCIIFIILGLIIYTQHLTISKKEKELQISKSNEKAFILENKELKNSSQVFKFTIDQLNYFNDSLNSKLKEVKEELHIKDKNLKQMQYLLSKASRTDTLIVKDTLFVDNKVHIDTLIGDKWYNVKLGLYYPNIITVTPVCVSEKYIILENKKETIQPPKKFFLLRWFQKKHKVVEVIVHEKNPYIENKKQRFIEILE